MRDLPAGAANQLTSPLFLSGCKCGSGLSPPCVNPCRTARRPIPRSTSMASRNRNARVALRTRRPGEGLPSAPRHRGNVCRSDGTRQSRRNSRGAGTGRREGRCRSGPGGRPWRQDRLAAANGLVPARIPVPRITPRLIRDHRRSIRPYRTRKLASPPGRPRMDRRYEILGELGRGGMGVSTRPARAGAESPGGPEDDPGRRPRRRGRAGPLPHRGRGRRPACSTPTSSRSTRSASTSGLPFFSLEFVRRRQPGTEARRHAAAAAARPPGWSRRWPGPCTTPTSTASSTATSSRPTSC